MKTAAPTTNVRTPGGTQASTRSSLKRITCSAAMILQTEVLLLFAISKQSADFVRAALPKAPPGKGRREVGVDMLLLVLLMLREQGKRAVGVELLPMFLSVLRHIIQTERCLFGVYSKSPSACCDARCFFLYF